MIIDASPPASGEAERVQLADIYAEFRSVLGEETATAERSMVPATADSTRADR